MMRIDELERSLRRLAGSDASEPDLHAIRLRARRRHRRRATARTAGVAIFASSSLFALGWIVDAQPTRSDVPAAATRLPEPGPTVVDLSTRLIDAVRSDDAGSVAVLIQAGADPSIRAGNGITLLMIAAFRGDLDTVDVLLDASAESAIHDVNDFDATALRLAAQGGHTEVVRRLVEAGADPQRMSDAAGARTPLMEAARFGHPATVALLLELGADPFATDRLGRPTVLYSLDSPDPASVLEVFRSAELVIDHPSGDPARSIVLAETPVEELVVLLCDLDTPHESAVGDQVADS